MNEDWLYSEVVKEHFLNPKNILIDEKDFAFDGKGKVGNIKCGDQMVVYIKVDKETEIIQDCRWKTYGCASAIASTSMLSEVVKGMTVDQAYNVTPKDIAERLGGLPENKIHCSVLGDKALRAAINDWFIKQGMKDRIVKEETKIICQCMNVTDEEIEDAVLEGARTYLNLQEKTKLGTVCGQCKDQAEELLKAYIRKHYS